MESSSIDLNNNQLSTDYALLSNKLSDLSFEKRDKIFNRVMKIMDLRPEEVEKIKKICPFTRTPTIYTSSQLKEKGLDLGFGILTTDQKIYGIPKFKISEGAFKNVQLIYDLETIQKFARLILFPLSNSQERGPKTFSPLHKSFINNEINMQHIANTSSNNKFVDILNHFTYTNKKGSEVVNIITEYCELGDLFEYSSMKDREHLKMIFIRDILSGLAKLEKLMQHRDIKPENIYCYRDNKKQIRAKIGDFGDAKTLDAIRQELPPKEHGTILYLAPEIIKACALYRKGNFEHKKRAIEMIETSKRDVWGAGLVLYENIFAHGLFDHLNEDQLRMKLHTITDEEIDAKFETIIQYLKPKDNDSYLDKHTLGFIWLIRDMLTVDPLKRPSAQECLERFDTLVEEGLDIVI